MSCFLRGDRAPYPKHLNQGWLVLYAEHASWTPVWGLTREAIEIGRHMTSVWSRPADDREPNIKKGGSAMVGVTQVPAFVVVICEGPAGSVDLVVPGTDELIVKGYFSKPPGQVPEI